MLVHKWKKVSWVMMVQIAIYTLYMICLSAYFYLGDCFYLNVAYLVNFVLLGTDVFYLMKIGIEYWR